ncbi:PTS system mannose-specific EIIBCA component [compost metagenome]
MDCEGPQQVEKLLHTFAARQAQGILAPSLMLLDRSVGSKEEAIKLLTDNLELEQRVTTGALAEAAIWQREAVFSTALGFSVALPHCKSPDVLHNSISVLRLSEPLAWGDDVDVTLVIMLTVNENDQHQHMKIFSRLARKLMHTDFRERLISIPHSTELVTLLNEHLVVE